MVIPVLICYTIDRALEILKDSGIDSVTVIRTGACFKKDSIELVERVVGQRIKNGFIELIVS